jgi:hypothetical protein
MEEKDWITAMVEREAIPKAVRGDTIDQFCEKWDIAVQTYHYQKSKKENRERTLEITLNLAKDEAPEILDKLVDLGKKGNTKAIQIYVDSILKLAKDLNLNVNLNNMKDYVLQVYEKRNGENTGGV